MYDHYEAAWNELTGPGAQFEVTDAEVRGIPMRVFASAPDSMRFVWDMARAYGDRDYLVFEDERLTYAETDLKVRALAHYLSSEHNVGRGDRVAIAMRNYPEWVIAYWASVSIGAVVVGMNAWWTGTEMEYGLVDSAPKVLIADPERVERVIPHLETVRESAPCFLLSTRYDGELPERAARWEDAVVDPAPAEIPDPGTDPDDDVCIFYTSGTTGFPKGAQIHHRGSLHNVMHVAFMQFVAGAAEAKKAVADGVAPADPADAPAFPIAMAPTPLFHVTANNCIMHPVTLAGGTLVMLYKWDAARALELIERERVNTFSGVPTMSREMLAHPDFVSRDTSSLKSLGGGGAPLHADLVGKIDESLEGGVPSTGYGLTETSGIVTASMGRFYVDKASSAGRVVPTCEAKLLDPDGKEVEPGTGRGELCVKGPIVVKGYLNRPEATADAIVDGWFRTGDIAEIDDDGFVYIVDRAKDMVIRGGENVYCSEVETAIYRHPAVAEVAVFGLPDERLGEEVAAAIVLREAETVTDEELAEFLAADLAKFKIPSRIWFRSEPLPQNANGKFLKRELRDSLIGQP